MLIGKDWFLQMFYALFIGGGILSSIGSSVFLKRYQKEAGTCVLATVVYLIICGAVAAAVSLAILLFTGNKPELTPVSFLYALGLVLTSAASVFFTLRALEAGQIAVSNTFSVIGGMMLSCIWGVVFLKESLSLRQGIGILLIFCAVLLLSERKRERQKYLLTLFMVFLFAGLTEILTKMHQIESTLPTVDSISFGFWIGAIRMVLFCMLLPLLMKRKDSGSVSKGKRFAFLNSFISGSVYIVNLYAAKVLPITVTTPLSTGISLICSALFAFLFYHERLKRDQIIAIGISFAGLVLIL